MLHPVTLSPTSCCCVYKLIGISTYPSDASHYTEEGNVSVTAIIRQLRCPHTSQERIGQDTLSSLTRQRRNRDDNVELILDPEQDSDISDKQ